MDCRETLDNVTSDNAHQQPATGICEGCSNGSVTSHSIQWTLLRIRFGKESSTKTSSILEDRTEEGNTESDFGHLPLRNTHY
ncbi:unnamed protein product [Cylicostephanus goldi]|uniref:Uncharacterized protein n=1 Tax=Cylicostephanus goldi TaxID=71465 RepID=A0A3P6QU34_CYLGO|nr:unnamed protein product [Cylicostephanus goldi]